VFSLSSMSTLVVPHEKLLAAFGKAATHAALRRPLDAAAATADPHATVALDKARRELVAAAGEAAMIEAAGIVAMFMAITRLVDGTGHVILKEQQLSMDIICFVRRYRAPLAVGALALAVGTAALAYRRWTASS